MNEFQRKMCITKFAENCYILVSFSQRDMKETFGEFKVKSHISFLYNNNGIAAEWEPEHGPIQIWKECDRDAENSKKHYFYDYVHDIPLNWSQLAPELYKLPQAANSGNFAYIFSVLKEWADR